MPSVVSSFLPSEQLSSSGSSARDHLFPIFHGALRWTDLFRHFGSAQSPLRRSLDRILFVHPLRGSLEPLPRKLETTCAKSSIRPFSWAQSDLPPTHITAAFFRVVSEESLRPRGSGPGDKDSTKPVLQKSLFKGHCFLQVWRLTPFKNCQIIFLPEHKALGARKACCAAVLTRI